ncbi:hypothetical protein Bca4012_058912 [Brassica carinata]|uniref:Pentatricopeptide repeat-containing protein n=1 Tax=Brassica carinata TaxID=52824 RepID=A0A8X8B495_BRACI|nr:hypothetical protein Bca52824_016637 [Brassica carinata]
METKFKKEEFETLRDGDEIMKELRVRDKQKLNRVTDTHKSSSIYYFLLLLEIEGEPTLQILTTMINGAGLMRNKIKEHQLFDEILKRGFTHDWGVYNTLMSVFMKCRDNGEVNLGLDMWKYVLEK